MSRRPAVRDMVLDIRSETVTTAYTVFRMVSEAAR